MITIRVRRFKGTDILWEIFTRNKVNRVLITEKDLRKHKRILEIKTLSYEPGSSIYMTCRPKFREVISKFFPQTKFARVVRGAPATVGEFLISDG